MNAAAYQEPWAIFEAHCQLCVHAGNDPLRLPCAACVGQVQDGKVWHSKFKPAAPAKDRKGVQPC